MNRVLDEEGVQKRLRVAYLFTQFPIPSQTFAVSDIEGLRNLGCEITVYTLKPSPKNLQELNKTGGIPVDLPIDRPSIGGATGWIRHLWTQRRSALGLFLRAARNLPYAPATSLGAILSIPRVLEVAEKIDQSGADVAHIFWSRHQSMVLAALADRESATVRSVFVGAYDLVAADFLVATGLENAEAAFTHARANLPSISTIHEAAEPVVIHRGIPLPDWQHTPARDREPLWLSAGSLTPDKNFEAVIQAFARARATHSGLRLEIYGEGPHRAKLEALAERLGCQDSIDFFGHIPRATLMRRMTQARAFILLSTKLSERLPNVVKEALWAGCVVIVSKTPGIEELVSGNFGHIVDLEDPASLDRAIAGALDEDFGAADARAMAAREMIEKDFAATPQMSRYVDEWRSKIQLRNGSGR
ncbi:glycosyltransferase family 4 protein [Altererythrobacter sp. MF3-039]|uniref:glycosyltransferase family 4 protein n=1 Tax=Altererythrobacter sp. MF3-039 TaxID=3252901 RepID=UPI00390CC18C